VNRRALLGTLAGGLLAAPLAAVGLRLAPAPAAAAPPRGKVVRLGVLTGIAWRFDPASDPIHRALLAGLTAHGYELGRNLLIEYRSADGNPERLPTLAAELVQLKVDVIVTANTLALLAAREATKAVPIVMFNVADPVETRIVESLRRPGGNITGLAYNASEASAKRVQLLQEAVPRLTRVAVLWNSRLPAMALGFQQIEVAAPTLGVTVQSVRVSGSDDFDQAFAAISRNRVGGLIVLYGPMRGNDLPRIVEFVTRHKLPAVFELERGARGGGLMEFGPSSPTMARQVGTYVDKIVNGAVPADLPVEEPTKFELVVNVKAARAMGLTIPQSLLLRADEVIQ
jgi:putative ABC transport system substrate-binding protein